MRESIHRYFQIGTISWMSFPGKDAVETVRRIAEDDFFDAIELTRFDSEEERARAKRLLDQSHLKVCYGAQPRLLGPGLNPNDLNEEGRLKAQATLIEAVDEAEALGARGVAFLAGKWAQETREEAYAQLLRTTRAVCAYAEGKGMDVNLEVFDYDMDKAALIGPAPLAARFAADVRMTCKTLACWSICRTSRRRMRRAALSSRRCAPTSATSTSATRWCSPARKRMATSTRASAFRAARTTRSSFWTSSACSRRRASSMRGSRTCSRLRSSPGRTRIARSCSRGRSACCGARGRYWRIKR